MERKKKNRVRKIRKDIPSVRVIKRFMIINMIVDLNQFSPV